MAGDKERRNCFVMEIPGIILYRCTQDSVRWGSFQKPILPRVTFTSLLLNCFVGSELKHHEEKEGKENKEILTAAEAGLGRPQPNPGPASIGPPGNTSVLLGHLAGLSLTLEMHPVETKKGSLEVSCLFTLSRLGWEETAGARISLDSEAREWFKALLCHEVVNTGQAASSEILWFLMTGSLNQVWSGGHSSAPEQAAQLGSGKVSLH